MLIKRLLIVLGLTVGLLLAGSPQARTPTLLSVALTVGELRDLQEEVAGDLHLAYDSSRYSVE